MFLHSKLDGSLWLDRRWPPGDQEAKYWDWSLTTSFVQADVCRETGHAIVTANEMMLQFKGPVRTINSLQDKS